MLGSACSQRVFQIFFSGLKNYFFIWWGDLLAHRGFIRYFFWAKKLFFYLVRGICLLTESPPKIFWAKKNYSLVGKGNCLSACSHSINRTFFWAKKLFLVGEGVCLLTKRLSKNFPGPKNYFFVMRGSACSQNVHRKIFWAGKHFFSALDQKKIGGRYASKQIPSPSKE